MATNGVKFLTDEMIGAHRADLVFVDKKRKACQIIRMPIAGDALSRGQEVENKNVQRTRI